MIRTGIVGAAGYTGGELLRLLIHHPEVEVSFAHSRSQAALPIYHVHTDLLGDSELCFTDQLHFDIDLLFLCMGHGASSEFMKENQVPAAVKIIDLSQDFRMSKEAVYGLPELNRDQIKSARFLANPGCFATAIQLALLPLAYNGMLREVHLSGMTGSTGAGVQPLASTHFSWRDSNVSAYKVFTHQHMDETGKSLQQLQPWFDKPINFVPYRGNFTRGIFVTAYQHCEWPLEEAIQVYKEYYEDHPFTWVSDVPIDVKQVVNTNKCVLHLEKHGSYLVIHSAIDNLLKGASGQSVQNMNLMFGLSEKLGLNLKPSAF